MSRKDGLVVLYIVIFFSVSWGVYLAFFFSPSILHNSSLKERYNSTLELVHVLMRHGDRNPEIVSLYPSGPFYNESFYPDGYGQLYNTGKKREYNIGTYLRTRYDDFLGPTWNIKHLEALSSDYNRTKMSLQLALAGLYPPTGSQIWSPLYWQPIPYNYIPKPHDKILLPYYTCSRYMALRDKLYEEPEMKKYLQRYEEMFQILSVNTEKDVFIEEAFAFYIGFKIQEDLGYPLEKWTEAVYPEPLHSLVIDMYYLMTNTTEIRRIISGYLLQKILADTEAKINNTIVPPERKMFIYSAHEMNIATILLTLGTNEKIAEIPPYGAYILFEVHKIDGVYGIKLFYQNYKTKDPVPLRIKGCDYFCPYDDFYRLLEKYLPMNDEECFGTPTT